MATRILVPYDGSRSAQQAIPCAVGLARATRSRIVLVRAVQDDSAALLAAETDAQSLAHRIREASVAVTVRVRAGDVLDIVDQETRTWSPDWIVLSTHGASGAGRWLFGGVADEILRHADAPVMLVPVNCHRAWAEGKRPHIVVALDGSPAAEQALPAVRGLVRALRPTVDLLRVVEPPIPGPYAYGQCAPYVEFDPHVELAAARAYLQTVGAQLELPAEALGLHAVVGAPGVSIPLFARDHRADLVVLTLRGAGGTAATLGGAVLGTLQLAGVTLVLVPVSARAAPAAEPVRSEAQTVAAAARAALPPQDEGPVAPPMSERGPVPEGELVLTS